jgi:hypothetical protein
VICRGNGKNGGLEMARKVNVLIAACLFFAVDAEAISGDEWRRLSQTAQQYYVIGVLDGWDNLGTITLLAEQQPPVGTGFTRQIECTVGMASVQINAIIQKYMESNPSQWHYNMALLVWTALDEVCASTSK